MDTRRVWAILGVTAAIVVVASVSLFAVAPAPDAVQIMAEEYVRYLNATAREAALLQRIAPAARPRAFGVDMSRSTFADSVHFRTTYSLRAAAEGRAAPPSHGERPLPYPPGEAWCAEIGGPGRAAPVVIVIAQHRDLHTADWVLHEPADAEKVRTHIGCRQTGGDTQ